MHVSVISTYHMFYPLPTTGSSSVALRAVVLTVASTVYVEALRDKKRF